MKIIKRGLVWAFAVFSALMTFLPESVFANICIITKESVEKSKCFSWIDTESCNIIITRILIFLGLFIVSAVVSWAFSKIRRVRIKGNNYSIVIEYGDLLKKKGQRLINFDECFTTKVGMATAEIKPNSVCGQYLRQNPNLVIQKLIAASGVQPCNRRSLYNNSVCYEPGTIVVNGNDLLMAFTRLDVNGKSKKFTVEEYLKCLRRMWEEIDNHFCNKDVYIPVLGSGLTRFENGVSQSISKQELVDLMISSYKLSPYKIKSNNSLHIVCRRSDDFSIDKVN